MNAKPYVFSILIFLCWIWASCSFTKSVNDGESAFNLKQYALAIEMLHEEYNQSGNQAIRARKSFLIGKSYQKMNNDDMALEWYKLAVDQRYGPESIRELAFAYKKLEMYDQAISAFMMWEREGGPISEIRREIGICRQSVEWLALQGNKNMRIDRVSVNTPMAEYGAVLFDSDYLVFTSDRESSTGENTYFWTGNSFSDLYMAKKDGSDVALFDEMINTDKNEGAACFSRDFSELYFTRCARRSGDDYCRILWSQRRGGSWTLPVEPFFMDEDVNYGQPTLVENDSVLIFSTDHPDGSGGYDLFYCVRGEEGWDEPFPMPAGINTQGNEKFPVGDGDTLYYSSDYLPGLGGLDIFKAYLTDGGQWSTPENLKSPINSGADDFSFVIDRSVDPTNPALLKGFFSSSRRGLGNDDIYRFAVSEDHIGPAPEVVEKKEEPRRKYIIYLACRVVTNLFQDAEDPNSPVIGKDPIPRAKVEISLADSIQTLSTDQSGRVIIQLEEGNEYNIAVSKTDYLNNHHLISTSNLDPYNLSADTTINVELRLDKIFRDKEIILTNIYYDYDEWYIRDDAKPSLDYLSELMQDNPQIRIQLSSHTDCRGEEDYNEELSQLRAQAAINYIISKGIRDWRLIPKGYGESRLAIDCECGDCSEPQHQTNRRTTFKIIN